MGLVLGMMVQDQELDSISLVGPFQLKTLFYDGVKENILEA